MGICSMHQEELDHLNRVFLDRKTESSFSNFFFVVCIYICTSLH